MQRAGYNFFQYKTHIGNIIFTQKQYRLNTSEKIIVLFIV